MGSLLLIALLAVLTTSPPTAVHALNIIGAGQNFFSVVQVDGTVFSWGQGLGLGTGSLADSAFPLAMVGVTGVKDIACGQISTCVLESLTNGVKCTGSNANGQLGDGTKETRLVPGPMAGDLNGGVASISCGRWQCAAVTTTGGLRYWGSDGIAKNEDTPVPVAGYESSGVSKVALGFSHTCILTTAGGVLCMGFNAYGQVGDGTTVTRNVFTPSTGLSANVVDIAASQHHTCAMGRTGAVRCWGYNGSGQLGDGSKVNRLVSVAGHWPTTGAVRVFAGYSHSCAVMESTGAMCAGASLQGEFGTGALTTYYSPVPLAKGKTGIVETGLGISAICVVDALLGVECAGSFVYGQLGRTGTDPVSSQMGPVRTLPVTSKPTRSPTIPTMAPTLAPTRAPSPPTQFPSFSPTVPAALACQHSFGMKRAQCAANIAFCKTLGITMKWVGTGCTKNGIRQRDGGCRCAGYCGFKCKKACNRTAGCKWGGNKCRVAATNEPYEEAGDGFCK